MNVQKHIFLVVIACAVGSSGCTVSMSSGTPRPSQSTSTTPAHSGPIKLALYRPEPEPGVPGDGLNWEKMNSTWRGHFAGYDLSSQDKTDKSQKDASKGKYNAFTLGLDVVRVVTLVGTVKKAGYDPKTRKPVEVTLLRYTATIEWPDGRRQSTTVEGSVWQNEPLLKDLSAKVRAMVR